ncbi:hypothetical protein L1987_10131 [Smallanthus sonchifolius]|uniref:Uncharacterized protein n=1 Tax=Smallanthus sonchifolius TaxID=185202 RepID=A0ACB9JR85_9ASTR|nr:hypothetical protein L1987_10131 [Smallanthus sonchifolius]
MEPFASSGSPLQDLEGFDFGGFGGFDFEEDRELSFKGIDFEGEYTLSVKLYVYAVSIIRCFVTFSYTSKGPGTCGL